jgi:hypothetical protein
MTMTNEQLNIICAEAEGWEFTPHPIGGAIVNQWRAPTGGYFRSAPDYGNDLNAMHRLEKVLGDDLSEFARHLAQIVTGIDWDISQYPSFLTAGQMSNATAAQRREAFVKTVTT